MFGLIRRADVADVDADSDETTTSCNCSFLFLARSFALHLFQLERHLGDIDMSHVNPSANICWRCSEMKLKLVNWSNWAVVGGGGVRFSFLHADQVAHQSKSVIFIKFDGVCWSPGVFAQGKRVWKAVGGNWDWFARWGVRVMKQKLIQDNCSLEPQIGARVVNVRGSTRFGVVESKTNCFWKDFSSISKFS